MAKGAKKASGRAAPADKPSTRHRAKEFAALAKRVCGENTGWFDAHNRLFGPGAHFIRLFPTREERMQFARSPEAAEVKNLLAELPKAPTEENDPKIESANGHITLRVPRSLHAALIAEADAEKISLNQLLLTKPAVQLRAIV